MRMMNTEPDHQRPVITHFSHSHPLVITNLPENLQVACSGCGINIIPGKAYYSCGTCGFCLHGTCYNLPRKISHPTDPNHHLILILSESFHCRGCGKPGSGFSYSCRVCSQDYHSLCTLKPLSVSHQSHSHPLMMEFAPVYEGKGFLCDLCNTPGGFGQWFYSCSDCGFDIHLNCAKSVKQQLKVQVPVNRVASYSSIPGANQAIPAMPITVQRSLPVNSPITPVGASQFRPGAAFVNQTGFDHATGAPMHGINSSVPNILPAGSYVGNTQTMFLRPTSGVPVTTVLQPSGSNQSYAVPMSAVPNQGGMMNGMQGMFIGGVASGIGQQLGQDMFHGLTGGLGDGLSSSDSSGLSDIVGCWIGGSDYY